MNGHKTRHGATKDCQTRTSRGYHLSWPSSFRLPSPVLGSYLIDAILDNRSRDTGDGNRGGFIHLRNQSRSGDKDEGGCCTVSWSNSTPASSLSISISLSLSLSLSLSGNSRHLPVPHAYFSILVISLSPKHTFTQIAQINLFLLSFQNNGIIPAWKLFTSCLVRKKLNIGHRGKLTLPFPLVLLLYFLLYYHYWVLDNFVYVYLCVCCIFFI